MSAIAIVSSFLVSCLGVISNCSIIVLVILTKQVSIGYDLWNWEGQSSFLIHDVPTSSLMTSFVRTASTSVCETCQEFHITMKRYPKNAERSLCFSWVSCLGQFLCCNNFSSAKDSDVRRSLKKKTLFIYVFANIGKVCIETDKLLFWGFLGNYKCVLR